MRWSTGGSIRLLVPTLITDDGESLGQSLAIVDWLDRHYPQMPLLPQEDPARMRVLEMVYAIACDIHPINNMRVLRYLSDELKVSEADKKRWYAHWISRAERAGATAATIEIRRFLHRR